jgi:putative phosphoribosyl transferase
VRFRDRSDAGRRLAERLEEFRGQDLVVLGLPRGGVPVAAEVARALAVPLDVIVVRKVGVPFRPELAMGAVGEGGVLVVDDRVVELSGVTPDDLAEAVRRERLELDTRVARFRGDRPPVPLAGRSAVLVDDGIATGSTARAACAVARALGATRIVLATPVCPPESAQRLAADVDELICLEAPRHFAAVGQFYADFRETGDEEVLELLDRAARTAGAAPSRRPRSARRR